MNDPLIDNLKSRDVSASKKEFFHVLLRINLIGIPGKSTLFNFISLSSSSFTT